MTRIARPTQGRRAKAKNSAFIKPSLKRGIAVIGTSGLVFGLGVSVGSPAFANNPLCVPEQIIRPVGTPQAQAEAIQSELRGSSDGLVCLEGDFIIDEPLNFTLNSKVIGLDGSSITVSATTGRDQIPAVFDSDAGASPLLEVENVDVSNPYGKVINAYAVEIRDSRFFGHAGGDDGGAIEAEDYVVISNSTLSNFSALNVGGAIYALGSVTISNSTLSGNTAGSEGGAIRSVGTVNVSNSTLSNNRALGGVGGAISSVSAVTVSNSTLSENTSTTGGGAIYADGSGEVNISNSTLTENTTGTEGGAIFTNASSTISNSTVTGNSAVTRGGGIWGQGTISTTSSTFFNNEAERGGAIFGHRSGGVGGTVNVRNSTFVENKALGTDSSGGAIDTHNGEAYFNTFVNNQASAAVGGGVIPGNALYKYGNGQVNLGANIFGGSSPNPQLGIQNTSTQDFIDNGGNIFSTSSSSETDRIVGIAESTRFESSLSVLFGTPSPVLATYAPNSSGTQTIGLAAGSPALGLVPDVSPFTSDAYRVDQRGADRAHPRSAGAFQGVAPSAPLSSGPAPSDFTVFTLPSGITKPGSDVRVSGANLSLVKEVYVNGLKVRIKKQDLGSLVFTTPLGLTGVVDVRFVSANTQYTRVRALDFGTSAVSTPRARTVVGGFAANSTRLTMKMKREIRAFLKVNPGFSKVTCLGFTSEPSTIRDAVLANARGQVTCTFIKKLDPDLTVKVEQGRHTQQPGSSIRRVRITVE